MRVALTTDFGKLLSTLASVEVSGQLHLSESLKVAKLALKRFTGEGTPNRRIVAFVGSPVRESKEELQRLGAELKKSNISIDVVSFGEHAENSDRLEALIAGAQKENNCNLVVVPPGPLILVDAIMNSAAFFPGRAEGGGGGAGGAVGAEGGGGGGGGGAFEFGVDPSVDPELAMALRLSMEEERRRQERLAREQAGGDAGTTAAPAAAQPS